ncbi:hypothetical protein ATCC90586_001940 [Pythium insidiosum]|nr:hypothetical protein ATCC90586_001940 [Pythium insidiosum]
MLLRRGLVLLVVMATALQLALVRGDPREVESAEFKDDFGEDFDERLTRAGDLDLRLEFELEHNVPSAAAASTFSPRGKVEIVISSSSVKPKVSFLDVPTLRDQDVAHLEKLLRRNKHYTLRARSDPLDPTSPYVVTSIPMCMLAGTRMREDLAFHLSDNGKLLAIEYLTPYISSSTCAEYMKRDLKGAKFAASGTVLKAQNGPVPPKQVSPKQKKAPKGVKKPVQAEEGEQAPEENQSFLRKYWYIILPLVVMSLFGGEPAPQNAGAGGAPAAGAGAAAGGARRR